MKKKPLGARKRWGRGFNEGGGQINGYGKEAVLSRPYTEGKKRKGWRKEGEVTSLRPKLKKGRRRAKLSRTSVGKGEEKKSPHKNREQTA